MTKLNAAGSAARLLDLPGREPATTGATGSRSTARAAPTSTGYTDSADSRPRAGAFDTSYNGGYDAFVTKLDLIPGGYPRPRGASPLRVPLAPAYKTCAAPNSVHGAGYPRVRPAIPPSRSRATSRSGRRTRRAARERGRLGDVRGRERRFLDGPERGRRSYHGDPYRETMKSDLSDYTAAPAPTPTSHNRTSTTVRALYRSRSATPPPPLTSSFPVTIPCSATGPTTVGSSCSVATTANAVLAGVVGESRRTIWQLDRIQVFDGGADEVASTGDNALFKTQAVFVP